MFFNLERLNSDIEQIEIEKEDKEAELYRKAKLDVLRDILVFKFLIIGPFSESDITITEFNKNFISEIRDLTCDANLVIFKKLKDIKSEFSRMKEMLDKLSKDFNAIYDDKIKEINTKGLKEISENDILFSDYDVYGVIGGHYIYDLNIDVTSSARKYLQMKIKDYIQKIEI